MAIAQPVITSNPQSTSVCMGGCVDLRVAAVGNGLTYHWQADDGSGFVAVSSASAESDTLTHCDSLTTAPVAISFRCVVVDVNGDSATSNIAVVTNDSCLAPIADFTFTFSGAEVCFTNTTQYGDSYLWNFGNGNTSNQVDPCNDYGTAWIYDVTLYAYNEHDVDVITKTIDIVGIQELSADFSVFPNPASEGVYIQSDQRMDRIQLWNVKGELVQTLVNVSSKQWVDLKDYAPGVYTLVLASDDQVMYHKVIKL